MRREGERRRGVRTTSAPRDLTNSMFFAEQEVVTVHPSSLSIWIATMPTEVLPVEYTPSRRLDNTPSTSMRQNDSR